MYTTLGFKGRNIDCCDHEHETIEEAQKCLVAYQNELRKLGQVTNRKIMEVESLSSMYDELI